MSNVTGTTHLVINTDKSDLNPQFNLIQCGEMSTQRKEYGLRIMKLLQLQSRNNLIDIK